MAVKQKLKKKKKNTLVPDILFRMPIKDNVTCKMCKLLPALRLPPLLRPSSEFVLPLQRAETPKLRRKEHQGKNLTDPRGCTNLQGQASQ